MSIFVVNGLDTGKIAKKRTGYNFCDTILPYHHCE
jgi:hypothetical protein